MLLKNIDQYLPDHTASYPDYILIFIALRISDPTTFRFFWLSVHPPVCLSSDPAVQFNCNRICSVSSVRPCPLIHVGYVVYFVCLPLCPFCTSFIPYLSHSFYFSSFFTSLSLRNTSFLPSEFRQILFNVLSPSRGSYSQFVLAWTRFRLIFLSRWSLQPHHIHLP